MRAIHEIREERNDVYSFWETKKELNETQDAVIEIETKIDECTILELEKRIADLQQSIVDANDKIELEQNKINLVNSL